MKHLYIIGNGFDIFTGIKSSYADFKKWLQRKYPFIYENLCDTYEIEGEWWNDFEINLGKLDIFSYIDKFIHKNCMDELSAKDERDYETEELNIPPSFRVENPCADRLDGLLDILQYCFEKWAYDILDTIDVPQRTYLEKNDSFFVNFNYTDTLQLLYKIPEDRVFHIHGRASKHEHLVIGHNQYHKSMKYDDPFVQIVCQELENAKSKLVAKRRELNGITSHDFEIPQFHVNFANIDFDGALDELGLSLEDVIRVSLHWYHIAFKSSDAVKSTL